MAGSENGSDRAMGGVSRVIGARSASPAKRSATVMEEGTARSAMETTPRPMEDEQETITATHVEDAIMSGMTPAGGEQDAQEMDINSASTSTDDNVSSNTSASSLAEEVPEKHTTQEEPLPPSQNEPHSTARIDEQVAYVTRLMQAPLDEGVKGVVVSKAWLRRVLSRSTEGLENREYPKEAREGLVGPMDNSDIVPEGAFDEPHLKDVSKQAFIPLKLGLTLGEEIDILPYDAYGYIISEYGHKHTKPIIRYAHNTADPSSGLQNVIYETYPPVVTIRKVPRSEEQASQAVRPVSGTGSLPALKLRKEARARKDVDAVRVVSSRSEKVQAFLVRCKEAAGIPRNIKVKVFRLVDPNVPADRSGSAQSGVPSPPDSRSTSPSNPDGTNAKLILDAQTFSRMKAGTNLEPLDIKDQTGNANYNGSSTVNMAGLFEDTTIVLEETVGSSFRSDAQKSLQIPKQNGSAPTSTTASGRTSPAPGGMMTRGRARKDGRTQGTVGLQNLGNTCYMNSALQCIRSVEELAIYFLTKRYKREINNDNPLGHHGRMANAYHSVVEGIYGSSGSSFHPRQFKNALGNAQPMFSGYGQQDSQEFLSFLVDALHEDLNRIVKKPYIENPDSDDATVHDPQAIIELGEVYRKNHRLRNDSVAMDLFSGFYKNKMECPDCDKVSVTFDPYSLLTVQLPVNVSFSHTVVFLPLQGRPIRHHVDIDKNATVKALKESVASKYPSVDASRIVMIEVWSNKIYKVFDDQSTIQEAQIGDADDIFLYEVEGVPTNPALPEKPSYGYSFQRPAKQHVPDDGMGAPEAECFSVPIISRHQVSRNGGYDVKMYPLYITVTREEAKDYEVILKKTLKAVANMTTRPILKEFTEAAAVKTANSTTDMEDAEPVASEDSAGVSDHSAQSEDGYVNVSHTAGATDSQILTNGTSAMQIDESANDNGVPKDFMDPQYFVSPALRTHLFELNYALNSGSSMHFSSSDNLSSSSVRPMSGRVKQLSRRSSTQSTRSEQSSSTANSTSKSAESDADDEDQPDLVLGEDSTLSADHISDSGDELAGGNTIMEPSPVENTRGGRGNRRKKQQYTHKNKKRNNRRNSRNNTKPSNFRSSLLSSAKPQIDESSPYYIQLGEAIVLDWKPEAIDALFGGKSDDDDELRGHRTLDDKGREAPVFPDPELDARVSKRRLRQKNGVTLEECFAETGKREVLSEDNTWYCNRCKELRRAAKTLEIWTLPDILVVHLKRFGGSRGFRDKLDINVDYPIEGLDMSDKVGLKEEGKEYIYDLFAVDLHFGGLGGGHYTAVAKNFFDGQWYEYNDASCSKISDPARLHMSAAYLLFYRRRSATPLGNAELQELVNAYKNPSADQGEDDDDASGEERLGGPTRSSHGPSSASLVGAGVEGATPRTLGTVALSHLDGLAGSGGVGAGNSLILRNSDDPPPIYSATGNPGWNFDGVGSTSVRGEYDDDDAASTAAQSGRNGDSGYEDVNDEDIDSDSPAFADDDVEEMARLPLESKGGILSSEELKADFGDVSDEPVADIEVGRDESDDA